MERIEKKFMGFIYHKIRNLILDENPISKFINSYRTQKILLVEFILYYISLGYVFDVNMIIEIFFLVFVVLCLCSGKYAFFRYIEVHNISEERFSNLDPVVILFFVTIIDVYLMIIISIPLIILDFILNLLF